jgi:hypothetical protein
MFANSKTIKRYTIISNPQPGALRAAVETQLKQGFQPYGAMIAHGGQLHQPMVVYAEGVHFLALVDADE